MNQQAIDTPAITPAASRRWLTPLELAVLGAIWGASFLFMRLAVGAFGVLPLVEIRLGLGALLLLPFAWRARAELARAGWWRLAGIGAINSAIPFVLFAWGAERAPAGIGAISNSMTVPFTALVAYLLYRERFSVPRVLGLCLGFIGVAVLASGKVAGASVGPAVLAGTVAALLYGFGANLIRRSLVGIPASAVAGATLLGASLITAAPAIAAWPSAPIGPAAWLSAILLGVLCTGTAFVLYYRLILRIGAPRAAAVTYLIPLFGVIWAWMVLGEPLTVTMALAAVLILGGVALSQQRARTYTARTGDGIPPE
ncbi:MAG TPA: DMT family transporter [Steroidobacteraceae bacterium]|jgi:drug/metabolite transporter (DMT)-like permease